MSASAPAWQHSFAALQAEVDGEEWTLQHGYGDEAQEGLLLGFHVRHSSGFALDVLWASVVPQALVFANTPLDSDRGDAHTCEHLLLGKGARGRAVATLTDMSLSKSTAWTGRVRTCYALQCAAGLTTFLHVLRAKLAALLAPDAVDEEIRREVCHVALLGDALGGEQGTVYNEMRAAFQQASYVSYHALHRLLFAWRGEDGDDAPTHPLAYESGGTPQGIRSAQPAHLRAFHGARYWLHGMGAVIALPPALATPRILLAQLHHCLAHAEATPRPWLGELPGDVGLPRYPASEFEESWLPEAQPAPPGTVRLVRVPLADGNAPGSLVAAWPNVMPPEAVSGPDGSLKLSLLQLLVHLVAGGATSELHSALVAAETRSCDLGATSVSGYVSSEPGRAVCIGLDGIPPDAVDEDAVRRACETMRAAFERIGALADASPALLAFNQRALSHLRTMQRGSRQFLSAPPRFGVRGVHDDWLTHLLDSRRCAKPGAEVVLLSFVGEAAALEALLSGAAPKNVWAPHIAAWRLASQLPVAVATRACAAFAEQLEQERAARMQAFSDALAAAEEQTGEDTRLRALERFRRQYDAATAVLDAVSASAPTPDPPRDPPLTEDDALDASPLLLPGGGRLLACRFVGMTGGHVGVALSLKDVPRRLLGALCALPAFLKNVGVTTRRGERIDYRELCCRLQSDVLYLEPRLVANRASGRAELLLRAAGLTLPEAHKAIDWLEAMLTAPDLTPGCLPRVRSGVDAAFSSARSFSERRAEFWQDGMACCCLSNATPTLLLVESHSARAHALLRLRWRLRDPPEPAGTCIALLRLLAAMPAHSTRAWLEATLAAVAADGVAWPADTDTLHQQLDAASPDSVATLRAAAADLRCFLPCMPDATLTADWAALCMSLEEDMVDAPASVLDEWAELLRLLRCRSRARAFLAAGPAQVEPLTAALRALVARMPAAAFFVPQELASACMPLALTRAVARGALAATTPPPRCIALVVPRLAVGGVVSMAACAAYCTGALDDESLLDLLAAQQIAGGGAHSLFMRGWAAGLAYSCGVSAAPCDGRVRYYADTAPDTARCVAATAEEVVRDAQNPAVPWRAEYALAQCFTSRAGTGMPEARAEAAASDDADGRSPERVSALRTALLRLRARPDLADELHRRAPRVLGALLPGVPGQPFGGHGWSGSPGAPGSTLVVVGPEAHAAGVEAHLQRTSAAPPPLVRLYERDLWVVTASREKSAAHPADFSQQNLLSLSRASWSELHSGALLVAAAAAAAMTAAALRSRWAR